MSALRARVARTPYGWQAEIFDTGKPRALSASAFAPSWPEAMQAAELLLRDFTLMDLVHADRAARRDPQPHGRAARRSIPDPLRRPL